MKAKLILISMLLSIMAFSAIGQVKVRFVHEPDLRKILPKFLTSQGFLDPKFAEATAVPSRYYSDFYGIQALKTTSKGSIQRDFVPKYAELVSETENTVQLRFKQGFTGTFYPNATLRIMGVSVNVDHVEISGETWQKILENLDVFKIVLRSARLESKYLVVNPHYKDEVLVAKQMASNAKPFVVPSITLEDFNKQKNAILLYPEGVHGNLQGYDKLKAEVLDKQRFDWIAMEMLMPSQQKTLDAFVKASDAQPVYAGTRATLLAYFKDAWNGRSGPKVPAENLYYFNIVEQMRAFGTRVIGMERSTAEYILFRYGENKFGGAVRSLWWVQSLPKTGKGLVFGGSGHFTDSSAINFQDLLRALNPRMKQFVIEPIKVRKN